MDSHTAQDVPRAQIPAESETEPVHRASTVRTTSTLHHNEFDDHFLSRYVELPGCLIRYRLHDCLCCEIGFGRSLTVTVISDTSLAILYEATRILKFIPGMAPMTLKIRESSGFT